MTEKADCLVQLSERKVSLNLYHLRVNLYALKWANSANAL